MSNKKKGVLPRIEILIILVFFVSFLLWAMSKCSSKQADMDETAQAEEQLTAEDSIPDYTATLEPLPQKEEPVADPATSDPAESNASRLYVTIDGLNMRTDPGLSSEVIYKCKLFEEVYYMNEYTDSTYQLSLGKAIANEPYIKVRNNRGKVGWVYGAGVDYRKKKREGVE